MSLLSDPNPNWNDPVLSNLREVLIQAFQESIPRIQELALGAGLTVGTFPQRDDARQTWIALLDVMALQGKLRALIEAAAGDPTVAAIRGVLNQALALDDSAPDAGLEDPFETPILNQDRPFINREAFRGFLREMDKPDGRRFLLVNGPPGSGKSYSFYLLETLAVRQKFAFCSVELDRELPEMLQPEPLSKRIAADLKLEQIRDLPEPLSDGNRWAIELGIWLTEQLRNMDGRCWIMLDGFGREETPPETRQLLNLLIEEVDRKLAHVRLLLMDYPRPDLPRSVRRLAHGDELQEIGRAELGDFWRAIFKEKGLQEDEQMVQNVVDTLMAGLPTDDNGDEESVQDELRRERMEEIMFRVMETIAELFPLG